MYHAMDNIFVDSTWTLTSHLKKQWTTRSNDLDTGNRRVMPDLFEGVTSLRTDPKRTRINEIRLELLESDIADRLVLRNCHHYPTLSEAYRAHIRSWQEDDPRLRFAFQATRLSDERDQQTRILSIILERPIADVKRMYTTEQVIKKVTSI